MEKVKVRTTVPKMPLPPNSEREELRTERLIVRPMRQEDLEGMWALRTQPAVMVRTARGTIDPDLAETQSKLDPFLPPRDLETFNHAIVVAETGEFIGCGGFYSASDRLGWPEVGYMLKEEHWGKGYASEFMQAWLGAWFRLPRHETEMEVSAESVSEVPEGPDGIKVAPEQLVAIVVCDNPKSQRVVGKAGFRKFTEWVQRDNQHPQRKGQDVTLIGFGLTAPAAEVQQA